MDAKLIYLNIPRRIPDPNGIEWILDKWVLDDLILADDWFVKALQGFETCLSVKKIYVDN